MECDVGQKLLFEEKAPKLIIFRKHIAKNFYFEAIISSSNIIKRILEEKRN